MMQDTDAILDELKIRKIESAIFNLSYDELHKHFGFATGGFNATACLRNLIWQDYTKLQNGELKPFYGNIRSYWYSRAKPVLARAKEKNFANKYDLMSGVFVEMVVDKRLFSYRDFWFMDEGAHNRKLGEGNGHILLVSEKVGHVELLKEIQRDYGISIVALGGQPSALSSEYLLRDLEEAGFSSQETIPLLTIVDFDPAGDIIVESFMAQLRSLGFTGNFKRIDLVQPGHMHHRQIQLHKYKLPKNIKYRKKIESWIKRTGGLYPYNKRWKLYGLEADSMAWEELTAAFEKEVQPFLVVPRKQVVRRRLKRQLAKVLKEVLLRRLLE